MKTLVWALVVLLVIVHQDFWWWDDSETLILGFVPIGLFYHALLSVAAGAVWWMAVGYAWPEGVDDDTTATTEPVDA